MLLGNSLADQWAKRGAGLWAVPPEQVCFLQAYRWRQKDLGRSAGTQAAQLPDAGTLDNDGVDEQLGISFRHTG